MLVSPPVVPEPSAEPDASAFVSVAVEPESKAVVASGPSSEEDSCCGLSDVVLSLEMVVPVDVLSDSFVVCPASELEGRLPASGVGISHGANPYLLGRRFARVSGVAQRG